MNKTHDTARRVYLMLAIGILLIAAGLRTHRLAELPPGPHYDEAANMIITRTVAFGGARYFPMVENYQGREVLYYYLGAPFMMWVQDSRFALQLVGVYSNLLMVATTIALGRLMFPGRRGLVIGLAAGVAAAISLPQILLARQAFRAITLPMMQGLALVCLWRGLNVRRRVAWGWLLAGGLLAGMTVYTYNSSRLFPLWLGLAGFSLLLFSSGARLFRLKQGAAFFLPLVIVALPFALYAVQKPDIFFGRLYEVTGGENEITLLESVSLHARMFFIKGEDLLRYNPPGRPYFTLPEGVLLLVGAGAALWTVFRHQESAATRAAGVLLLLSPLMVLPSVIATSGLPPNHMRSIAMAPLVFIIVGLGFYKLAEGRIQFRYIAVLLFFMLFIGSANVLGVYFNWATRADLYINTDADLAAAAVWAREQVDEPVYFAAQDRNHPTVAAMKPGPVRRLGTDTLFLPAEESAVVIFPRSAPPPEAWREWLNTVGEPMPGIPLAPDGRPAFEAVRLRADVPPPPQLFPVDERIIRNDVLSLNAAFKGQALPAGRLDVVTAWDITRPPAADDLTPIVHMEDSLGHVIARAETFSSRTSTWQAGETLLQRVPGLRVPIGTPPGTYMLKMTWVERAADRYLPYTNAEGAFSGVWAEVGQVDVLRPNAFPPPGDLDIEVRKNVNISNGIVFLGFNRFPTLLRPGEMLSLMWHWRAASSPGEQALQYDVVLRRNGTDTHMTVNAPLLGNQPTHTWIEGQLMTERLQAALPRDLQAGTYTMVMRVSDGTDIELGLVEVAGLPRAFTPPSVETIVNEPLGSGLMLHGYTITTGADVLRVRLVWHVTEPVAEDYTVFVHVVGDDGQIISQRDVMPQDGLYPTSLWAQGEFIEDVHTLLLPAQRPYAIRVGMYTQADGTRLEWAVGRDAFVLLD